MKTTPQYLASLRAFLALSIALLFVLPHPRTMAQGEQAQPVPFLKRFEAPGDRAQPAQIPPPSYMIPGRRASQYTREDWGAVIDSTWGPGQSAADQLQVFDSFADLVRQYWAGFPNLASNCAWWDSVRNAYRPQIGSGLSRGRFYALMSRMWMALSELHTYIFDPKVDQAFGSTSFKYRPGVPLLNIGPYLTSLLGAAVTPLPDSTNLVYRVAPDNPLHLEPGDLILGYEGIPWKRLYPQLVDAGIPVSYWNSWSGSSPASVGQFWLMSVGLNWGIFDTIDIVKYNSGDTLHLATARLDTTFLPVWQSDQVPVPGVPMPETQSMDGPVTQGIVEGTNIGYIYVWDWYSALTAQRFSDAIQDLCYTKGVDGLVIDCRMNWGGNFTRGNAGLSQLFNFDPTANLRAASRSSVSDCMAFSLDAAPSPFVPTTLYEHPIALLIGPGCFSVGDYNALRLSFHPMARLFGKPTNGAFVAGTDRTGTLSDGWEYSFPTAMTYSLVPGEGFLMHKGTKPDEEVWLTRDGVAKGEDDVVKRALQWMSTLTYAHDVQLNRTSRDTLQITARVQNPLGHIVQVLATLRDGSRLLLDSLLLVDDGAHGDSAAGDGLWGFQYVPRGDNTIRVSIRTDDKTAGTSRSLPDVSTYIYTRRSIISVSPTAMSLGFVDQGIPSRDTTFKISNTGYSGDSIRISIDSVNLTPSSAIAVRPNRFYLLGRSSQSCSLSVNPGPLTPNVVLRPKIVVTSDSGFGQTRFETVVSFKVVITDIASQHDLPTAFAMGQNYPNPFNPSTIIKYELPKSSLVRLSVYDLLGREVSVLVNERRDAGVYEVKLEGANLASGVYFYRLQAGDFVQTRKLLLVR